MREGMEEVRLGNDEPAAKAKSVVVSDEGARMAEELFKRHFGA
jgi:hypothetical protein